MDITRPIEPFELTQGFGENAALYARFGLAGHNGWDLRTKYLDTPQGYRNILASWFSKHYKTANEGSDGFGYYFEVIVTLKNTYKLTYAHCQTIQTFALRNEADVMAISDNTGNSTASHLHLTVKRGRMVNNVFQSDNYNNGYFGAINPQEFFDELRAFKKANPVISSPQPSMDNEAKMRLAAKSAADNFLKDLKAEGRIDDDRAESWLLDPNDNKFLGLLRAINSERKDALASSDLEGYRKRVIEAVGAVPKKKP